MMSAVKAGDKMCDKQRLNFYRMIRLLLEPCTDTLRYFLEKLYSNQGDLQSFLKIKVNKKKIKRLCQQNIITSDQKEILKPSNGTLPSLSNLDITLLCVLLTNLCHNQIGIPQCGWTGEPDDKDLSTGADILRLRKTRNKLYAHRTNAMMTDSDFLETWGKTCGVISRLSSHLDQKLQEDIQSIIDEISKAQLDPNTVYKLFDILLNQALCKILDRIGDPQPDHSAPEDAYLDGAEEAETEMAKGYDDIICLVKLYPDLKSNMTRRSLTAIAKRLLERKMINDDEYEPLQDTTKPRRCLTDMLLKKILRVDPEKTELLKCFHHQLRIHHPAMATKLSEMVVTEADRTAFRQVKQYGVEGKNAYMTSQISHKMMDTVILFFERCLCESSDLVDRINDELLSKFVISISDHSWVNQSEKKISTLFKMVQFHSVDVESVLEHVLEEDMLKEWKTLRCKVHVNATLDQDMKDNGHVMKDKEIPNPCSTLENAVVHKETAVGDAKDDDKMTNFCRFFLLVMDPGKLTLQSFLEKQYSAKGDLLLFLKSKEGEMNILCSKHIIKQWQVDVLLPTSGDVPTVKNLDISTICILLIYLCQITKPPNGWKELPSNNDRSTGADILRLLHASENLVFYRKAGGMSVLEFNEKWDNVHGAISRLSVQLDEEDIDDIRRKMVLIREESIDPGKERKINDEIFKRFLPQIVENQQMKLGEIITMDVDDVCLDQHNQGSFRALFEWMRRTANTMMNVFATQFQSDLKAVEKGSIVIKLCVWKNLRDELLDKDFVGKNLRRLIRRGCFESKVKLMGPVDVTVYIFSPEAQDEKEEIHFHLELDSIKHDVKKPRVHLKSQDMKLLVEEMDPIELQHWIFDQLQIDVNKQKIMNEIVSWHDLSRCDQMEILLDSIKRLENGFDMLAQYCKENDPYVYNKVFEKQEQLACPEESDTDLKAVSSSYHKGGGLQKLYSMQLDLDVEEQGMSDQDLDRYWTSAMMDQTDEQEYVYDKEGEKEEIHFHLELDSIKVNVKKPRGMSDQDLDRYWTSAMMDQTDEQEYVYDKEGGQYGDFKQKVEKEPVSQHDNVIFTDNPQVIKQNLLLHYGNILEEIEPLHFKDMFVTGNILDKSFFEKLKMIIPRRARAVHFLDQVLNKGSTALKLLVHALGNSGSKNLASRLRTIQKISSELSDKDQVDDTGNQVQEYSKTRAQVDMLWPYRLTAVRKYEEGNKATEMMGSEEGMKPITPETSTQTEQCSQREKKGDTGANESKAGLMKAETDQTEAVYVHKQLVQLAMSVGIIRSPSVCGTGFRVGPCYVMTAKHVVDQIMDAAAVPLEQQRQPCRHQTLDSTNVFIDFNYEINESTSVKNFRFHFEPKIVYANDNLDTVILKLKHDTTRRFPPPFTSFTHLPMHDNHGFLISHSKAKIKMTSRFKCVQVTPQQIIHAKDWSMKLVNKDGFVGVDDPHRVLLHCSFEGGASGAPGIWISPIDGKASVLLMLVHGYPDWYYDDKYKDERTAVLSSQLIGQGVYMQSIYYDMIGTEPSLCREIFLGYDMDVEMKPL